MKLQKSIFSFLDKYFPSFTAKQVYKFMSNPQVKKLRDFEEKALASAKTEVIPFNSFQIQTYAWGNPNDKTIFLIHGWEGQAGNFGALLEILLEKRYYIVAFDGPSHGKSSKGKTTMFEFADLVSVLLKKYQPKAVISHSFGSVTSIMAMSQNPDITVDQWIMVTTPHNFKDRIQDVANATGVTHRTIDKVVQLLESENQVSVDEMNMDNFGPKIGHVKEALIVHSKADRVLPIDYARSANKSIPQSKLIELDHLGHYRILWSDELKEIVTKHLN